MKLTTGHDCDQHGCQGLACYGMAVGDKTRWACRLHQHQIGFSHQPAGSFAAPVEAGPQAPAPQSPRAPAASPSQGRLL